MLKFKPYPIHRHAHCYGWDYIIQKLHTILPQDEVGIILDDFVETFFWNPEKKPHVLPWIGILHSTPTAARHLGDKTLDDLLEHPNFIESLPHCRLLIVLCDRTKNFLQDRVNVPIKVVYHPKDSHVEFDVDDYLNRPMLFHAGFCRRSFAKYYELNTQITRSMHVGLDWHLSLLQKDLDFHHISMRQFRTRIDVHDRFLSDGEYLGLLRNQIGFCWLYDSAASNSIVESIVSHAPIVANRLPAIVEYLGDDYPLYYEDIARDPDKHLLDRELLSATVDYLRTRSHLFRFDRFSRFFLELELGDAGMRPPPSRLMPRELKVAVPEALSLSRFKLCNGSNLIESEPPSIDMPRQQWAYGILFPFDDLVRSRLASASCVARLKLVAEGGPVGVAACNGDWSRFTTSEIFASGAAEIRLSIESMAETAAVVIRQVVTNQVRVTILEIGLFEAG